jgi:alpha-beta hydrolase superfamily lysophospholipase
VRKDLPVNLAGGAEDPSTFGGKAVQDLASRMRRMGFSDVALKIYPGTRHESLNEINRSDVTTDFIAWADRVTA